MTDLPFWQQVIVSAAGGVGAAAAVGVAGFFFLRWQQRIRWEEEGQGELAKLRQRAAIEMIEALGAYIDARMNTIAALKAQKPHDEQPSAHRVHFHELAAVARSKENAAWDRVQTASVAKWLLVPHPVSGAIQIAAAQLREAQNEREMGPVIATVARQLEPYMPKLRRRRIWRSEYPAR